MLLAIVPAAPPTRKNQRATSCPAPISANVPYFVASRLIWSAFWWVSSRFDCMAILLLFKSGRVPLNDVVEGGNGRVKPRTPPGPARPEPDTPGPAPPPRRNL